MACAASASGWAAGAARPVLSCAAASGRDACSAATNGCDIVICCSQSATATATATAATAAATSAVSEP